MRKCVEVWWRWGEEWGRCEEVRGEMWRGGVRGEGGCEERCGKR